MKFTKYLLIIMLPVVVVAGIFGGAYFMDLQAKKQLVLDRQKIAETPKPAFEKTVLLRNSFWFKDGQNSSGASAVLVEAEWGVAALTAKHLLGPAMGIEPAVK
ncbi:MAG: hypothetical protein ACPGVN_06580, partial [Alphaproteobacteria bacterium]